MYKKLYYSGFEHKKILFPNMVETHYEKEPIGVDNEEYGSPKEEVHHCSM